MRGCTVRNMDPEKAEGLSPELQRALEPLLINCTSEAEINSLFSKLSAGGKVVHPLKEEFWGSIYGDFHDKFGVRWMMNWDKPKK